MSAQAQFHLTAIYKCPKKPALKSGALLGGETEGESGATCLPSYPTALLPALFSGVEVQAEVTAS